MNQASLLLSSLIAIWLMRENKFSKSDLPLYLMVLDYVDNDRDAAAAAESQHVFSDLVESCLI